MAATCRSVSPSSSAGTVALPSGQKAGIRVPGFRVYEVAQHYCTPACAISSAAGVPYYYDRDHMTVTGSRLLQGTLSRMLADVVASHGDQSARAP